MRQLSCTGCLPEHCCAAQCSACSAYGAYSAYSAHSAYSDHPVRHDICQIVYATAVSRARILRRKRVNRDISQYATKARKCFKWTNLRQNSVDASN